MTEQLSALEEAALIGRDNRRRMTVSANQGLDSLVLELRVGDWRLLAGGLQAIEWLGEDRLAPCPACWAYRASGHRRHCELATLLAVFEADASSPRRPRWNPSD
jgi:hypothetical protein